MSRILHLPVRASSAALVSPVSFSFLHGAPRLLAAICCERAAHVIRLFELATLGASHKAFVAAVGFDQLSWHLEVLLF
jgi:hypothetical protein